VIALAVTVIVACSDIHAVIVDNYPVEYETPATVSTESVATLELVAEGLTQITDIQFFPGSDDKALIAQKQGKISVVSITKPSSVTVVAELPVRTNSEQGVLGLAFHPQFQNNRLLYVHSNPKKGESRTEISEWQFDEQYSSLSNKRIIFELKQPYSNHNGGQIQFGSDGYLYIGLGDGGWRDDPHDNGQDTSTALGTILRLDPSGSPYSVPKDNPFLSEEGFHPLIWAYGLRNPWRFSFLPDGRIITGDVGQGKFEEVSIIAKGNNLGWNIKEGYSCFKNKSCDDNALVDPVYVYPHSFGASITGGYVITADSVAKGMYIFGDFTSGRIWKLDISQEKSEAIELLQSGLNISTFGRSASGTVFVGDFSKGGLYRLRFD
jgi:glucose/arabinose dehydrogenase